MRVGFRLLGMATGALMGAASLAGCPWPRQIQSSPSPTFPPGSSFEQDRSDILSTLASGSFDDLFASGLINDGIGIFSVNAAVPALGARRWGCQYDQGAFDIDAGSDVFIGLAEPLTARVEFSAPERGVWLGDFPWRLRLVSKPIAEQFHREALFAQEPDGSWRLTAVSPGIQAAAAATVAITDVAVSGSWGALDYSSASVPIGELPVLLPGQTVNVVLHATGASASAFVQDASGARSQLIYDGTDDQGMRFSGQVAFGSGPPGPAQLGLDVFNPSTLESPQAPYDAVLWGVPAIRQGGAS